MKDRKCCKNRHRYVSSDPGLNEYSGVQWRLATEYPPKFLTFNKGCIGAAVDTLSI